MKSDKFNRMKAGASALRKLRDGAKALARMAEDMRDSGVYSAEHSFKIGKLHDDGDGNSSLAETFIAETATMSMICEQIADQVMVLARELGGNASTMDSDQMEYMFAQHWSDQSLENVFDEDLPDLVKIHRGICGERIPRNAAEDKMLTVLMDGVNAVTGKEQI